MVFDIFIIQLSLPCGCREFVFQCKDTVKAENVRLGQSPFDIPFFTHDLYANDLIDTFQKFASTTKIRRIDRMAFRLSLDEIRI